MDEEVDEEKVNRWNGTDLFQNWDKQELTVAWQQPMS